MATFGLGLMMGGATCFGLLAGIVVGMIRGRSRRAEHAVIEAAWRRTAASYEEIQVALEGTNRVLRERIEYLSREREESYR